MILVLGTRSFSTILGCKNSLISEKFGGRQSWQGKDVETKLIKDGGEEQEQAERKVAVISVGKI